MSINPNDPRVLDATDVKDLLLKLTDERVELVREVTQAVDKVSIVVNELDAKK